MNIRGQFLKYVSQNICGMLGISCYIIVDTFFISVAAGTDGITVLNLVLPVYSLIFAIGSMIGVGSATRYAILKGQGKENADRYFSNAVFWIIGISIPFILTGIFAPDKVLRVMGADAGIMALGQDYTRIFLLFTPFFMLNFVFSAFVRNDKAPTLAMVGTMTGSLMNVIFDYIFMFPMGMGLKGAALATAASPIASILICSIHFLQKKNTVRFVMKKPDAWMLVQSCQLGVPAFIGEISSGITTALFNFLILGLVGNVGVAAYGVIANLSLIFICIFDGIAQGAQPLVSRYYGQGKPDACRKLMRLGIGTAFIFGILIVLGVWAFTDPMIALFNSEQSLEMAEYAHTGLRMYVFGFLVAGFNIVGTGYLSATGNAKTSFLASISRGFVAIAVFSILLSRIFGLGGVWCSFAASEAVTAVITAWALGRNGRFHECMGRGAE